MRIKLLTTTLLALIGCTVAPVPLLPPDFQPTLPYVDSPQVTDWIRASCWWVDELTLANSLSMFELSYRARNDALMELNAFVDACAEVAGYEWYTDCLNCGAALIDEVWR